jgi:uncharacterized protein YndB with AHSA1/START domain
MQMNKMENTAVAKVKVTFKVPVEKVWEALTDPQIVKQYFFGTDLVADWKVGGAIYFRGVWEGTPYEDKGIIQAIEHHKHLAYLYRSSWDELPDTIENYLLVTYDLKPSAAGTDLYITQQSRSQEQAKHSEENWNGLMEGMRKLIEA